MKPIVAGLIAACLMTSAAAQTPPAKPCSGPEFRTLDFWVGDWVAEWTNPDGTKGTGTNRVTRDEFGDCAIVEHFKADDGSLTGGSMSIYVPKLQRWRQTWVDDQGGYFDLEGGPQTGQDHVFYFQTLPLLPTAARQRMIWQEVRPDSFTWRWQKRADDKAPWTDSWVIRYRRRG
jgi:hypothetical protein